LQLRPSWGCTRRAGSHLAVARGPHADSAQGVPVTCAASYKACLCKSSSCCCTVQHSWQSFVRGRAALLWGVGVPLHSKRPIISGVQPEAVRVSLHCYCVVYCSLGVSPAVAGCCCLEMGQWCSHSVAGCRYIVAWHGFIAWLCADTGTAGSRCCSSWAAKVVL